jgi:rhamnogalacturonan endolyase
MQATSKFFIIIFFLNIVITRSSAQTLEKIDRGEIALVKDKGKNFISWRLLETDKSDITFDIYRKDIGIEDYVKINEETAHQTNYTDDRIFHGRAYEYKVVPEGAQPDTETRGAYVFSMQYPVPYVSINLKTDDTPRNVGIADLDGDGKYDFIIKFPDFNVDPWNETGYWKRSPEPFKLEAYTSNGKHLWTYDMGWSIETGTWYSPYLVYDIDGDGYAEVYCKGGEGDPREIDGHVMTGPEFLMKIDGRTGKVVRKIDWISKDGFENYNYWSRNFLGMAYLDGSNPSIVLQRGTYTIIKSLALNKELKQEWYWESTGNFTNYKGQGQHGMQTADIDNDGKDELIIGSAVLDDNGTPMWTTGLGHNDVGHVADIDPQNPGLEIFYGLEKSQPRHGVCLVDALTGKMLWAYDGSTIHVHGQGMAADIDPVYPGMECYAGEAKGGSKYFLYSASGERLSDKDMGSLSPRPVWWDEDEIKEVIIGDRLLKYKGDTILKIEGKILMVGDILGDWREEIVTGLPGELRIYSTTIPCENSRITLVQDRQYRLGVSRSTMGYYYPPQLSLKYRWIQE